MKLRSRYLPLFGVAALLLFLAKPAHADTLFYGSWAVGNWSTAGSFNSDGSVKTLTAPAYVTIDGSNNSPNGPGSAGEEHFSITAPDTTSLTFDWLYTSSDDPGYDAGGYAINGVQTQLSDYGGQYGTTTVSLNSGDAFYFYVWTEDNFGGPGYLKITPVGAPVSAPEPSSFSLLLVGLVALAGLSLLRKRSQNLVDGARPVASGV